MTLRRLVIRPGAGNLDTDTFAWAAATGESSFLTNLGPELPDIGAVPRPHQDLVAFAVAVFFADRTVRRPTSWHREIDLEVPVYDVARWEGLAADLAQTLELLSSDTWRLTFTERPEPVATDVAAHPQVDRVLLFSGGADSLCGAIRALADGERVMLVSHWDWTGHAGVQDRLSRRLATRFPEQVSARRIQMQRRRRQIGPAGGYFGDEASRRTRSLLFVSLGLAHAVVAVAPLWIAENGYAALNPPLAGERRGALSTRTTHPLVLHRIHEAVLRLGGTADFENPFTSMTKGEMYRDIATRIGDQDAEALLGASHSCSHVRYATGTGFPPETQCGVCFGCLVRRAAFYASRLDDAATYLHKAIPRDQQPHHLRATAESEIRAVRYAGERGVHLADILSVGLPDSVQIEDALGVARRGLAELAAVVDAEPDLRSVQ